MRGDAISISRKIHLVSTTIVCLAVMHNHISAAGRLSRRGSGRTLASTPCVPQLALESGGETKREPVTPIQQA
eukprot:7098631-Pyramimonas_sp.AAC.1